MNLPQVGCSHLTRSSVHFALTGKPEWHEKWFVKADSYMSFAGAGFLPGARSSDGWHWPRASDRRRRRAAGGREDIIVCG